MHFRISRAGPRSEPTQYEMVSFKGCFRRADAAPRGVKAVHSTGVQMLRRSRGRDESQQLPIIGGNDVVRLCTCTYNMPNDCYYIENFHSVCIVFAQVLIAMAKVMKQPTIVERLFEASKFEYKTRHLIDGRIVQCDQRISIVAGYMADEVSGLSPFTFMHRDDVRWVMVALRQSKFSTKVCLFIRDRNQQVHKQMSYVPHAEYFQMRNTFWIATKYMNGSCRKYDIDDDKNRIHKRYFVIIYRFISK